ncbi:MAG: cytochrome P450 [Chloroflexi bacterium]|nr:cytochrome P450 [Chloroflexota bacterium]
MAANLIPPGPRPRFIGDILLAFRSDPIEFLLKCAREYGDIVYLPIGPRKLFILNNPDYIRDVLVTNNQNFVKSRALEMSKRVLGEGLLTSESKIHLRQRRLVQPAFHKGRIAQYGATMVAYAARWRQRWQPGMVVNMAEEMMGLTLSIVGKTLFDTDVEAQIQDIGQALSQVMDLFTRTSNPFADLLEKLPLPSNRRFDRGLQRLNATIYCMINARRASGEDRGDLLSMLLLAQDSEGDGGFMSDLQVRDEAMTIFLAGHETTANALTWTWYLLSEYPDIAARLYTELDTVLGERLPTLVDMPQLEYTRKVLTESMRLFPPAWVIARRVLHDYPVAGYTIPADATIFMSQYVMHHDPRYFPDPFRFNPERWTAEALARLPKFAYFPFGGGPRVCIGESFAWMEGVLLVATLAQAWKMRLVPAQARLGIQRVEMLPRITLRPKYGMQMALEQRFNHR